MSLLTFGQSWIYQTYHTWQEQIHAKPVNVSHRAELLHKKVEEDGITIVPDFYTPEQCEQMRLEIDMLLDKYKDQIWRDQADADNRLHGAEHHSELLAQFAKDPLVHETALRYYQGDYANISTLAARITAKNIENLGSGGGWHRDSVHQKQFKTLVYLSDVEMNNGPFQYIKKSHSRASILRLSKMYSFKANQLRFEPELIEKVIKQEDWEIKDVIGKAGTMVLTDSRGLHRGMPIQSGSRYALTNYLYAKHTVNSKLNKKFATLFINS